MSSLDGTRLCNTIETNLNNLKIEVKEPPEMNEIPNIFQDQEVWINPVHGYIYQLKVLMLFLHRGLSCKYSFKLGTEIKKAKKFDDLVFEYVNNNKKVYRLLQAKHKFDESKKITVDKLLTDPKGDYSLVKYFHSFQACKKEDLFKDGILKDVIICTNINFDFDDLKKSGIKVKKVEEQDDILNIISDEKESMRYKFTDSMVSKLKSKIKSTVSDDEIEDFLNHLIFAVNQPNEEELGQILKKEIGRETGFLDTENAYNKLLVSMMDLSLGKNNRMFLSHEEGRKFFDSLKREIPVWFNIQEPVMSFTGRSEYLERIHGILTKKLYACISGMGGVGKTELARKYIVDYADEYDNQVVWINAESYRSASDSFRRLASDKLNISLNSPDGKEKHITSIVTHVYQFFSKGKCLFIFDNAEKYKCKNEFDSGIERFLPCLPNNCIKPNVIITSRNQKWPGTIEPIVLEAFKADEAKEFVRKMLGLESNEQKQHISELCETLQYFPLALQQAVAYIKMQREKLPCTESNFEISNYLKIYLSMSQNLLDFAEDSDSNFDSNYDKSVWATWNITFDALKQKDNGKEALEILNILAYVLPENIPVELLLSYSIDNENLNSAIGLLQQYSLVTVQHKSLDVHRLVQQVTRIKLQIQNEEVKILLKVLKLLNREHLNFKNIDHVISIWSFAREHSQLLSEYLRVSTHITSELHSNGRYEEAISIGNEALKLSKALPQYNLCSATIQNNIALCYIEQGEYKKALEDLQKMSSDKINDSHKNIREPLEEAGYFIDFLETQSHLAYVLNKLGRNREALQYCFKVLNGYKDIVEESHPHILKIKSTMSVILSDEGQFEKALSVDKEIYNVKRRTFGDRHAETLSIRKNIAITLGKLGKIEECLKTLEQVCKDQEVSLPKNHPSILSTKCAIADILTMQRKDSSALKMYEELLDIYSEKFGENHPEVIDIILRMGLILHLQSNYEESLKLYKKGLDKQKIALGHTHPSTLGTLTLIANIYVEQKKYTDAMKVFKDVLDKQISVLGSVHKDTLKTRRSVTKVLGEQKEYDAALKYSKDLVDDVEKIFGKNHPSTLKDRSDLGMAYFHKKDFNKAVTILNQVLEDQESHFGKDDIECQTTKNNIMLVMKDRVMLDKIGGGVETLPKVGDDFLSAAKKVLDINIRDGEGLTMLHKALQGEDEGLVEFSIEEGAEVFVVSNKGNTPLHIAALKGREKSTKLMLEKVRSERLKDFVDAKTTSSASTALHVAAKMAHYGIVKYLLKSHATFCAKNKDGKTPLNLSTDPKIKKLLKLIHELFDGMKQADAATFVLKLKKLPSDELSAIGNTHDDQGLTLSQVAISNNQKNVAAQILKMMQKSK